MPIPTLSNDDITTIRRQYIRDLYIAPVPSVSPAVALSHYNRATKDQFISNDDLQALATNIARSFSRELGGVYTDSYDSQLTGNISTVTADAEATAFQLEAFFRLIRAAVFEQMMIDPGFVGSVADENQRAALFSTWKQQINKDRQFTRNHTSAPFRSLPLERF